MAGLAAWWTIVLNIVRKVELGAMQNAECRNGAMPNHTSTRALAQYTCTRVHCVRTRVVRVMYARTLK